MNPKQQCNPGCVPVRRARPPAQGSPALRRPFPTTSCCAALAAAATARFGWPPLSRVPGASVLDLDAGCCGMAGSFGYTRDHYDVSRAIGERKLFPAIRTRESDAVVVAGGTSCRHQISHFTGVAAIHPAVLLQSLLTPETVP